MRKAAKFRSAAVSLGCVLVASLVMARQPEGAALSSLPTVITAAAANPARSGDLGADATRHGPEILAFAGLKPGQSAIDLIPGGGYWTRLMAGVVGPKGHVYGVWPKPYAAEDGKDFAAYSTLSANPAFANVSAALEAADQVSAPKPVDLVFTAQNYHDYPDTFMGPVDLAVLNKAVFDALKPGGVYLVIDHVAVAGSGLAMTDTLHRIDPAAVKAQVTAAGFVFEGESALLANPADDHSLLVFDKAIRGHTDQFVYKFRKPR